MGSRIATQLLNAGYGVTVWNRSPERLEPLLERGAAAATTPREAAEGSQTLITMLTDVDALRSVSQGPYGIAAGSHPGLTVVEMSTVGPAGVATLTSLLGSETHVVDAPVIGSLREAESGTLTIFAGARNDDLERVRPVLETLGTVIHVGPVGAGAAAKLVANAALLGTLTALGETLALAATFELSPHAVGEVLGATPLAEQMQRRLPLIEDGTYPRRFGLSLARKDIDLILDSAAKAGLSLPALAGTQAWLSAAEAEGRGKSDYTAMLATMFARRPFDSQPHLIGELVELRPLRAADFAPLFAAASDPLIWEQHPVPNRYREDVFPAFFLDQLASGGGLVVLDRRSREVIGTSRFFRYDASSSEVEIGFTFLVRKYWGGIYNGEVKSLMLTHAFRYVRNVFLLVDPHNLRSQRAVEKIGGVRVGVRTNIYGDESIAYRITSSEWTAPPARSRSPRTTQG